MRATSPIGSKLRSAPITSIDSPQGFSLVELLVVLALIGLSLTVVGPSIGKSLDASRLNASVRSMLTTLRHARSVARAEQREVTLMIDVEARKYRVDDQRDLSIQPNATTVEVTAAESERHSENLIGVRFFPDGSATGGLISFSLNKQRHAIEIDWLTGLAEIQQ